MLTPREAAELHRALSIGQFEKSPTGSMLDHLELYSYRAPREPETLAAMRARKPWEPPPQAVTARPTAEQREQGKADPDSYVLEVYGRVSRKLQRVAEKDPDAAAALAAYYGDIGARWGRGKLGRIGAVLHLTPSGRKMIARSASKTRGARVTVSEAQRIENDVNQQIEAPTTRRGVLLTRAIGEAVVLMRRAEQEYQQAGRLR